MNPNLNNSKSFLFRFCTVRDSLQSLTDPDSKLMLTRFDVWADSSADEKIYRSLYTGLALGAAFGFTLCNDIAGRAVGVVGALAGAVAGVLVGAAVGTLATALFLGAAFVKSIPPSHFVSLDLAHMLPTAQGIKSPGQ